MFSSGNVPFTMNVAPTNGVNGSGIFGNGNDVWIIILFALIFVWGNGGYGYGNGGGHNTSVYEGYVLNNDFSVLSNQMSQGFASQERKLDSITNGLCDGFYTTAQQINGVNTNIMQGTNTLQAAVKDCCCQTQQNIADVKYTIGATGADISRGIERGFADTNYNLATQSNMIDRSIADGFCKSNFAAQTNTRDIVDSANANTRAILDKLCQMENNAKDDKIAELTARNADLRLAASQAAQNSYLISELRPCPSPAYVVPNPYCNCNCNNYGYNGTTIA